jgi:hypothetical protein
MVSSSDISAATPLVRTADHDQRRLIVAAKPAAAGQLRTRVTAGSTGAARPACTPTLGAELERDRLERRLRRATVAIAALHDRVSGHRPELGTASRRLRQTIADFEAQIEALSARLRDLGHDSASAQLQETERPR